MSNYYGYNSALQTCCIDMRTLQQAKQLGIDPTLVAKSEQTRTSLKIGDCGKHRNLINKVRKHEYTAGPAKKVCNDIIHYMDDHTYEEFLVYQQQMKHDPRYGYVINH